MVKLEMRERSKGVGARPQNVKRPFWHISAKNGVSLF